MGLSRNKVAVSEGAAGSPPFYGVSGPKGLEEKSVADTRRKKLQVRFEVGRLWRYIV